MAMTLRFPTELDEALQRLADARHTSKHSLVLRAVEELVISETKTDQVMASVERTLERDAELLQRLEDA
ncbi:MAG: ribbon-helix-helix protein, CopG family [Salinibacterium sp.]|nr:MAG: ribbon-helix-helix protein, CopG family [Salinibacterium sp.]